jgi:tetratricopeptide (TPR) repeat protein
MNRVAPAYETYEDARRALADDDFASAEAQALEAAQLVSGEGHFHALLGDIDYSQNQHAQAAAHYSDAIARNEQYFYYHLRRGYARERLGQNDAAETDLRRSLALLPTAEGYYGLGSAVEQRGDRAAALEAYREAARSAGAAGQAAQDAIVRLDLPANPGQYLALRTGLDASSMLAIEIGNPTRARRAGSAERSRLRWRRVLPASLRQAWARSHPARTMPCRSRPRGLSSSKRAGQHTRHGRCDPRFSTLSRAATLSTRRQGNTEPQE